MVCRRITELAWTATISLTAGEVCVTGKSSQVIWLIVRYDIWIAPPRAVESVEPDENFKLDEAMKLISKRITVATSFLGLLFGCSIAFAQISQIQIKDPLIEEPPALYLDGSPNQTTAQDAIQIPVPQVDTQNIEQLPAAQAVVDGLTSALDGGSAGSAEVVTERYENSKVKIEREVVQDQNQNYINHGKWKTYDRKGNVIVEGRYKYADMDGVWTRIYYTREAELLNKAPFNQGQLPLVSQANFKDGNVHGKWVIYDAHKRRLCEWEFTEGKRDGTSTWWYSTGMKMREITYQNGTIDGELNEWDRNGKQVTNDVYVDGRRLSKKTESFANRSKRAEGTVLYPQLVLDSPDNWQDCTLATYTQEGEPVKHGTWTSWFPNGQKKLEGQYEQDVPTGAFTWWHENGQRSLVASYRDGKKHGTWTWWHESGLKSIQGSYANDTPVSNWLWWKETGKVAQRADFNDPNQRHILAMPTKGEEYSLPSASTRGVRNASAMQ